jgi:hypothetical protein
MTATTSHAALCEEIARLRKALREIAIACPCPHGVIEYGEVCNQPCEICTIARKALEE